MTRPFVMIPIDLVRCPQLSDSAVRLWALVRGRNGEKEFKACFESAARLSDALLSRRRMHRLVHHCGTPTRFKRAQQELISNGLLVVKRRGPGRTAHRWALAPGAYGELELRELLERGDLGDQELASTNARRAVSKLFDGLGANRLAGVNRPTIQNQTQNQ